MDLKTLLTIGSETQRGTNLTELDSYNDANMDRLTYGALDQGGEVMYVTIYDSQMLISLDVSDPTDILLLDTLYLSEGACFSIAVTADYAFISTSDLVTVDITDPSDLTPVGTPLNVSPVFEIVIDESNDILYGTTPGEGYILSSYDISDPLDVLYLDDILVNEAGFITQIGSIMVCTGGDYVVYVYLDDPSDLSVMYSHEYTSFNNTAAGNHFKIIDGEYVLFVIYDGGIVVFDLTALDALTVLSTFTDSSLDDGNRITSKQGENIIFCTASGNNGIVSIDVSDPENLSIIDTLTGGSFIAPTTIALGGDVAYVGSQGTGNNDGELTTVNIS